MQEIMQFVGRHPMLSLAWIGLLVAIVVMTVKSMLSKVKEISRAAVTQLINKENGVIVDTRSHEEFRKGHIAHSINLIPSEIKAGSLGELPKHKNQPIIVVCNHGTTARASAESLYRSGFAPVYIMKDGISGWQGENLPLVKGK